jgi:hypothetical protein
MQLLQLVDQVEPEKKGPSTEMAMFRQFMKKQDNKPLRPDQVASFEELGFYGV